MGMGLSSELQFSREFPKETNPKAPEHWDFLGGGGAGGAVVLSQRPRDVQGFSSERLQREALDKGSLPSWGFSRLGSVV